MILSIDLQQNTESKPEKRRGKKWYKRPIAWILVVSMVVATAAYQQSSGSVDDLTPAAFEENGDQAELDTSSIEANMKAIEKYKALKDQLTDDYQKAQEYIEAGDYPSAIKPMKELYSYLKDDETAGVYLRTTLAELYYTTEDYTKCTDICEDMIERQEDTDGSIHFMEGLCCMQNQDFEKAITRLTEAMDLGYSAVQMCKAQIALANMCLSNFEEAQTNAMEVLNSEHDSSLNQILYYIAAVADLQLGKYEESIEQLNVLLTDSPSGEYYYYRGIAFMATEQYESAVADFKAAIEDGYTETGCYYNLGISSYYNNDPDTTEEAMKTVVERNDDDSYTSSAKEIIDAIEQSK